MRDTDAEPEEMQARSLDLFGGAARASTVGR